MRKPRLGVAVARGAIMAFVLLASPLAHAQRSLDAPTVMATVERLKPGEYLWAPEIAPAGPLLLVVSLATQRAVLYRNGVPIGVSTISSGRKGYPTPTGVFTVLEKDVEHYSSIYENAPMPYMQRLTWGGVALHAGQLPGYPASHGCVRLPLEFAKLLFGVTRLGMTVVVTAENKLPRLAPTIGPGILAGPDDARESPYAWHPERSPEGPVSIVVSGADRRVVVLRNGREIGSASVTADLPIVGTTAYLLQSIDADGHHWSKIMLSPVQSDRAPAEELRRLHVDPRFRLAVAATIAPGTTVVVTADTLQLNGGGRLVESE